MHMGQSISRDGLDPKSITGIVEHIIFLVLPSMIVKFPRKCKLNNLDIYHSLFENRSVVKYWSDVFKKKNQTTEQTNKRKNWS